MATPLQNLYLLDEIKRDYIIRTITQFGKHLYEHSEFKQVQPIFDKKQCLELMLLFIKKLQCKTFEQFKIAIFHFYDKLDLFKFNNTVNNEMYCNWKLVQNLIKTNQEHLIELF